MPSLHARLVALALGTVLSAGLVLAVEPDLLQILRGALVGFPDPWEAPARDARVRAEPREDGLPDWAGVYRTRWTVLRIAPRSGYTLYRGSGCELSNVAWEGGRVAGEGDGWVDIAQVEGARSPPPGSETGACSTSTSA